MSNPTLLQKIQYDIEQGNLGRACDRMHGLIQGNPNDLTLRIKLAEIYYQAKFLALAGKYWYLEENKTEAMKAACAEYEKYRGHSALGILQDLKFRGDMAKIPKYAKEKLLSLQKETKGKYRFYSKADIAKRNRHQSTLKDSLIPIGCITVLIIILILIIVGAVTVIKFFS